MEPEIHDLGVVDKYLANYTELHGVIVVLGPHFYMWGSHLSTEQRELEERCMKMFSGLKPSNLVRFQLYGRRLIGRVDVLFEAIYSDELTWDITIADVRSADEISTGFQSNETAQIYNALTV